jgi:hypothetical protein
MTMNLVEIARWLNAGRLSAAPCPWLSAISVFVDEEYENYDYDVIGPRARKRIREVLVEHDYRQISGRVFEGPQGRIEFPRPTRSLASDPAAELEGVVERAASAVFTTPTQVLLATWRREGPRLSPARQEDLVALVHEQPANLDKVRDWLRRTDCQADFQGLRSRLQTAQEEGFQLRRRGEFRSRLPR